MRISKNYYRLVCAGILFFIVFICFGFSVKHTWFREDDLGTIINGRVTGWTSAIRVFMADCRSFITPCNYQRTVPNFLSALWRPLQNYIFSVVSYFFCLNPMAFYLLQVGFHAANVSLIFILFSFLVPFYFAFGGCLLFAFYPSIDWIIWASTLQNSLSVFFMILMLICLSATSKKNYLAGLFYFLSLLSRESGIFLPVWIWFGAVIYFYKQKHSIWKSVDLGFRFSLIFFVINFVYACMRIFCFGFGSIERTFFNLFLRFPVLNKIFAKNVFTYTNISVPVSASIKNTNLGGAISTQATQTASTFYCLWQKSLKWIEAILNVSVDTLTLQIFVTAAILFLIIFLIYSYRHNLILMLWLMFGFLCLSWPGILLYPSPRYINAAYPMFIFIFIYGLYLYIEPVSKFSKKVMRLSISIVLIISASLLCLHGLTKNWKTLSCCANERMIYKKRFDVFFTEYKFKPNANFVLICSPYVSDIESIFQFYLNNFSTRVVFDPFATIAEQGTMGCQDDCRSIGVSSEIIKTNYEYRLISNDTKHCGWWLRHSNFNVAWVEKDHAYRWTDKQYKPNTLYTCSIGHFFINQMANPDLMTDVTFIYDKKWIDENTVFVAWDTTLGKYYVVSSK